MALNLIKIAKSNINNKDLNILGSIANYNGKKDKLSKMMIKEYKSLDKQDWTIKASLTLINSIITQDRKVFILTRESLVKLLDQDTNHNEKVRLDNNKYKMFISHISKYLVDIKKIPRNKRFIMVCIVKMESVLENLTSNLDTQYKEVIQFVTGETIESQDETTQNNILHIQNIIKRYTDIKEAGFIPARNSFKSKRKIINIIERYNQIKSNSIQK